MIKKIVPIVIFLAAIAGVIVSAYALAAHYDSKLYGVCSINETFDCSSVNSSVYADIFGIPVAGIGVAGYLLLAVVYTLFLLKKKIVIVQVAVTMAFGALIFSLYLSGIEMFVLQKWCLLCIISQISILIIFTLLLLEYYRFNKFLVEAQKNSKENFD
ncbi:hypothetical protein D6827_00525 [Candidatus Parcubacteria bacterium]|nr:MAG: hypothetical protein D6827_00525 [Candidatus Parcubacteria bacterium]